MKQQQDTEKQQRALDTLEEFIQPNATLYIIERKRTASNQHIEVIVNWDKYIFNLTHDIANAFPDLIKLDSRTPYIKGNVGYKLGQHVVEIISEKLFNDPNNINWYYL